MLQTCAKLAGGNDPGKNALFGKDTYWKALPSKLDFKWWSPPPDQKIEYHANSLLVAVEKYCKGQAKKTYKEKAVRNLAYIYIYVYAYTVFVRISLLRKLHGN
jgi:hypothetical protein